MEVTLGNRQQVSVGSWLVFTESIEDSLLVTGISRQDCVWMKAYSYLHLCYKLCAFSGSGCLHFLKQHQRGHFYEPNKITILLALFAVALGEAFVWAVLYYYVNRMSLVDGYFVQQPEGCIVFYCLFVWECVLRWRVFRDWTSLQ